MAGSLAMIVHDRENSMTAIKDLQWEIRFARFLNHPSLSSSSSSSSTTSADLHRRRLLKKSRFKGTWISTSPSATASLQLLPDHSTSDIILTVCFQGRILEEHFMSKLNFTWPHVSCVSGFPTRGSRAVFVCYKDAMGEIQKFALRFLTMYETEAFIKNIKSTKEDARDVALPSYDIGSEFSCQSEFVQSHRSPYRPSEEFNITTPVETSTSGMPPSSSYEVEQLSNSQETTLSHNNEGQFSYSQEIELSHNLEGTVAGLRPPSFTSLLTNCCSETNEEHPTVSDEVDFKSQIAKYMEDSSFLDLFVKVEKVVNELLEDDLMLSSSVALH